MKSIFLFSIFCQFVALSFAQTFLCPAKSKDLYGYIDTSGKWVIQAKYKEAGNFNREGLALVRDKLKKYFLINKTGKIIFKNVYGEEEFKTTKAFYKKCSKPDKGIGFTNFKGEWKVIASYTKAWDFSEGLAFVNSGGEYLGYGITDGCTGRTALIDTVGNYVGDAFGFQSFGNFSDGWATAGGCYNNYTAFISIKAKLMDSVAGSTNASGKFRKVDNFSEGLAAVQLWPDTNKLDYFWAYVNKKGEMIIPPRFKDYAGPFKEGIARIGIDSLINYSTNERYVRFGYINLKGDTIIPVVWQDAHDFSEGMAVVKNGDDWFGYINKKNEVVIQFQFQDASDFKDGRAKVKLKGKWGIINATGQFIVPASFLDLKDFN